jgi:hypothetical protein
VLRIVILLRLDRDERVMKNKDREKCAGSREIGRCAGEDKTNQMNCSRLKYHERL